MIIDKSLVSGSTTLLVLKLIEEKDMYGYQMIEELSRQSDETFNLKAGTLYPILHELENKGMVTSYDEKADGGRIRKYYHLTSKGEGLLEEKQAEWRTYSNAINKVLTGGMSYATV